MSQIGIVQPEATNLAGEELAAVEKLQKGYHNLKAELGKVIVGQDAVIEELLIALFCKGHALLVGVPAGYGIARMRAHKTAVVILIARITPGLSYLIPLFLLFQWLGLLGTLWPQIIIHLVVTVPIVIWIMIGYFETTAML